MILCLYTGALMAQTNTFPASGNVGIGTTSPLQALHISSGNIRMDNAAKSNAAGIAVTSLQGSPYAELNLFGGAGAGTGVFVKNNGDVGIGTTAPQSALDINGNTNFRGNLLLNDNAVYLTPGGDYIAGSNASGNSELYTRGQLVLSCNGNSTGQSFLLKNNNATALAVTQGGNIGIGTTSPSEKLSVDGNILARKVRVMQSGWSDYVFNSDYKLLSLSSLESFIKQNNHLPDVPSAKEVEEIGISVGDNQALLLKKIEELTLYIIDQDKRIRQLESRLKHK